MRSPGFGCLPEPEFNPRETGKAPLQGSCEDDQLLPQVLFSSLDLFVSLILNKKETPSFVVTAGLLFFKFFFPVFSLTSIFSSHQGTGQTSGQNLNHAS